MNTPSDASVPDDTLSIGRRLQFVQQNTTAKSPAYKASSSKNNTMLTLIVIGTLVVTFTVILVAFAVQAGEDALVKTAIFAVGLFGMLPLVGLIFYMLTRGVRYTNTLDVFAELNKSLVSVRSTAFQGVIGRLIIAFSSPGDGLITARNNQQNLSWGVTTTAGREVHVGRCYTTGPYAGFAHIAVKLTSSQFPHLIIDADANNHNFTATNLARILGDEHRYELEGDFPNYFKVFAANIEIARVAYYILTPDIMQLLIQRIPTFDIEIVDNTLHLYWQETSLASELNPDWAHFLPLAYQIVEEVVAPLVERIEKYQHIEELGVVGSEKLVANTAPLADVARQVIYGERNSLTTTSNKRIIKSTALLMVVTPILFLVLIVICVIVWFLVDSV